MVRSGSPWRYLPNDFARFEWTDSCAQRTGYNGHKKIKGSKVHVAKVPIAVDILGHLLALKVSPTNEDDRTQVEALCKGASRGPSAEGAWPKTMKGYLKR
jgi:hypothetical protein